jgi:protein-histidine N-methyltransferase
MAAEAARNDGRLARRPLENVESEIQAHRMLLIHLKDKIQRYSTVIEVSVRSITENSLNS